MSERRYSHRSSANGGVDSSPRFADESNMSSEGEEAAGLNEHENMNGESQDMKTLMRETMRNQHLILEEFEFLQQEQRSIKERLETLEKEQEKFHIGGYKRMEKGFNDVSKCLKQMEGMNEVFKEIIGIISGERIRFLDHSNENLNVTDSQVATNSELLEGNTSNRVDQSSSSSRISAWGDSMSYNRDRRILEGRLPAQIKREMQSVWDLPPPPSGTAGLANHGANNETNAPFGGDHLGDLHPHNNIDPEAGSLERAPNSSLPPSLSDHNAQNSFIQRYRMNRAIKTVTDLAREYYEGLPGQPSVMALERRFGSTWRSSAGERTFFHKRYVIIQRIDSVLSNPSKFNLPSDITRRKAVKVIENIRVGNNTYNNGSPCYMTLAQLYLYFSKHMDTVDDYSLHLKHKDVPSIREIKSRQKKNAELADERSLMT